MYEAENIDNSGRGNDNTSLNKKLSVVNPVIFIVEDNEVYANSLKAFLQNNFPHIHEIKVFRVGELCLLEMRQNPGVIILDYILNSKYEEALDGLEILRRIKMHEQETNVILLSDQKNISAALDAIQQQDCFYIPKSDKAFGQIKKFVNECLDREQPETPGSKN